MTATCCCASHPLPLSPPLLQYAVYGATKAAIAQLLGSLQHEAAALTGPGAVGVHNLSPGMVLTGLLLEGATPHNKQARRPAVDEGHRLCAGSSSQQGGGRGSSSGSSSSGQTPALHCSRDLPNQPPCPHPSPDPRITSLQVFNILCEHPETVAAFLVPRVRSVVARGGSGAAIRYLTPARALAKLLVAPLHAGRYFDRHGMMAVAVPARAVLCCAAG